MQDASEVKKLLLVVPDNQAFAFRSIASYSLKVCAQRCGMQPLQLLASRLSNLEPHEACRELAPLVK